MTYASHSFRGQEDFCNAVKALARVHDREKPAGFEAWHQPAPSVPSDKLVHRAQGKPCIFVVLVNVAWIPNNEFDIWARTCRGRNGMR